MNFFRVHDICMDCVTNVAVPMVLQFFVTWPVGSWLAPGTVKVFACVAGFGMALWIVLALTAWASMKIAIRKYR